MTSQRPMAGSLSDNLYSIERPVLDYGTFATTYGQAFRRKRSLLEIARDETRQQCGGCSSRHWANRLLGLVPLVNMLRRKQYSRMDLVSDIVAGFTTCVFHIPQGLAYGLLASLKPINGLYTSLVPVLIFALFGRSRHLSIGTFSLMALLLSDMIEANYETYLARMPQNASLPMNYTAADYAKLQTAIVGSFAASAILLIIGLLRLGFFMRYMSDAMLKGFTCAAAVQVMVSQLPLLLGIRPARTNSHFRIVASLINQINVIQSTNLVTLAISAGCCAVLFTVKEFINPLVKKKIKVPIPIELIVIVISLLVSKFTSLNQHLGVAIVGDVPRGLPNPLIPDFSFLPTMIPSAIPVGVVGGAITMSLAKLYCLQFQYSYDFNEDFFVLGISSLASSFFQCFFACGALARNSVVVSVGMKSQISSLISCCGMLLVLIAVGPFFETIPTCVLGAIIVVSLINVMSPVKELPHMFRASRVDFATFVISGLAVLILDVTLGLAIGFGVTLFSLVLRTQLPTMAVLGRVDGIDLYEDVRVCQSARPVPGLLILRFNAPVNFANSETLNDFALQLGGGQTDTGADGSGSSAAEESIHTVILDCSAWSYVDMVGVRTLREIHRLLTEQGRRLLLAACKDPVRSSFAKQDLAFEAVPGVSAYFVTIHDAVLFATTAQLPPLLMPSADNDVAASGGAVTVATVEFNDDGEGLIVNDVGVSDS